MYQGADAPRSPSLILSADNRVIVQVQTLPRTRVLKEGRMTRYRWAAWGDNNAFFGLMLDNVTVMLILVFLVSRPDASKDFFTPEFVLTRMIPGTALGVLLGDLVYTWMAFRLARRTGHAEVTAMPLGLDTPST